MRKYIYLLLIGFINITLIPSTWAQIKIGDNPKNINSNALFELESKTKGLLLPRVSLQSTLKPDPLNSFETGMMVYNIAQANDVSPGLYISDGKKWIKANPPVQTGSSANVLINNLTSSANQTQFQTPSFITDGNKIMLYRNGVMISFTVINTQTIESEIPCVLGDKIKIIQLL